jgi:hypothetical protein
VEIEEKEKRSKFDDDFFNVRTGDLTGSLVVPLRHAHIANY